MLKNDEELFSDLVHTIENDFKSYLESNDRFLSIGNITRMGGTYQPNDLIVMNAAANDKYSYTQEGSEGVVLSHTKRGTLHAYLTYPQKRRPIIMSVKWDKARARPAVMTDGRHSR